MTAHAVVVAITLFALAVVGMCWLRRGRESCPEKSSISDEERQAYDAAVTEEMTWRDSL